MNIKIDKFGTSFFVWTTSTDEFGDERHYYSYRVDRSDKHAMIIVCRNGLRLEDLIGQTVDANIGWTIYVPGFSPEETETYERISKLTIYKPVSGPPDRTLVSLYRAAPKVKKAS